MKAIAPTFVLLLLVACNGTNDLPDPDSGAEPERMCSQSIAYTMVNRPPCTWEWTCSDFSGSEPQYSVSCEAGTDGDVVCECRQAGAITGTMTFRDGCLTIANACEAANAACGFSTPITCRQ
jgi:hypothetical protein